MWLRNLRQSRLIGLFFASILFLAFSACADETSDDGPPAQDTVSAQDSASTGTGPVVTNPATCPEPRGEDCEEKTIWALDTENEECCEYNGFCKSPEGWEQYKDLQTCEDSVNPPSATCPPPLDNECEEKTFWAKNPDSGECCEYARPCTTPDGWEKFKDVLTCEEPSSTGSQCPIALEEECEEKAVWGLDKANNVCCEYAGFCMIPEGLEQYKDPETCENELVQTGPADCPTGQEGECEEKIIWAKNNSTGTCCQFNGFCHAPDGWETYKDPETCANDSE